MQLSSLLAMVSVSLSLAAPTPAEKRACTTGISSARAAQVKAAFGSSGVVPTLIPSIDPKVEVSVVYGGKAVNLGNQFVTTETLLAPTLSFSAEPNCEPNAKYSYFLVDPDVPNPNGVPAGGLRLNYLHWYVSGAQSACVSNQSPNTVAMYQSLTPLSPEQHRYTFLVYREPAGYQPDTLTPQTRVGFDVNAYAAKGGLKLVGGNFLREAITNGVPRK